MILICNDGYYDIKKRLLESGGERERACEKSTYSYYCHYSRFWLEKGYVTLNATLISYFFPIYIYFFQRTLGFGYKRPSFYLNVYLSKGLPPSSRKLTLSPIPVYPYRKYLTKLYSEIKEE